VANHIKAGYVADEPVTWKDEIHVIYFSNYKNVGTPINNLYRYVTSLEQLSF